MAYDHFQASEQVAAAAALTTAGVIAASRWSPGYQPVRIRAVAVTLTVAMNAAGAVALKRRPTPGSATGEETIATLTLANGSAIGTVIYADGFDVKVSPGDELVFDVTDATPTAGSGHLSVFYQPSWEHPMNNTEMVDGAA